MLHAELDTCKTEALEAQPVQHHTRPIVHHTSDLLTQAAAALYSHFLPAQEVILRLPPDGIHHATRWIEAQNKGCWRTIAVTLRGHGT